MRVSMYVYLINLRITHVTIVVQVRIYRGQLFAELLGIFEHPFQDTCVLCKCICLHVVCVLGCWLAQSRLFN